MGCVLPDATILHKLSLIFDELACLEIGAILRNGWYLPLRIRRASAINHRMPNTGVKAEFDERYSGFASPGSASKAETGFVDLKNAAAFIRFIRAGRGNSFFLADPHIWKTVYAVA